MAQHIPHGWSPFNESSSRRPPLNSRFSSVSDISSASGYRDSVVSLPSPRLESDRSNPYDEVDVSHVRLQSAGYSGVVSPTHGSSSQYNRGSVDLPDMLRIGSPVTPPVAPKEFLADEALAGTPPTPPTPPVKNFNPFNRIPSVSYAPLPRGEGTPKKSGSRRYLAKRKSSLLGSSHGSIPEGEEIDMSLLASATPMGLASQKTAYTSLAEHDVEEDVCFSPTGAGTFDISSFTGPMTPRDEAHLREFEKQERGGILTGGLGQGLKPDTTMTSTDLYANAPQTPSSPISPPTRGLSRGMSRGMSFRGPVLARAPTLRALGQSEANKRGEIIQVIVEEEQAVDIDISSFDGGNQRASVVDFDQMTGPATPRKDTIPNPAVEVFYPQKNWKPFSMKWPYLSFLIFISVTLAAMEEYLLQKSFKAPLFRFRAAQDLSTWNYFTFKYLPTMCAVTFGVLWQVTDFEVKRLEAFYQLSKEGGALAAESINVDYITFFNFLRPIKALRYKHYAVAVSSIATLMALSLIPTLQSASVRLEPERQQRKLNPEDWKEIHIDPIFSRLLSAFLMVIAICGCVLLWQLQRRRSGLVADVKGIAGIAAMANRSHILMDFKNMDTATPEMIHQKLKKHRYLLRNSSLAPDTTAPLTQEEKDKYDQEVHAQNPHPQMLRLIFGIPFLIGVVAFIIFIPIVLFQRDVNVLTDKAPWLLTALAVAIKLAWGTLETDVRMIEPFYILSKRHASPKVLTLDYTAMAFGWMPIKAFVNGHYLVGLVGLGSVLAEILTVCSTSFANVSGNDFAKDLIGKTKDKDAVNAGEETVKSFWISFGLSISILSFLCLVAVLVYARRRHPFLPRQPNTISSVLAFIHQSKMLYDFVGTEKMNNDEMVKRLVGIKKKYGLGWFTGRDGEMHCGVDEEELVSNYRHGEDTRQANMISGGVGNWENY